MTAVSDPQPAAAPASRHPGPSRWRNLVPIVLALFVLGAGFVAGIRSGLRDTTSHLFIDLSAMTAVLSSEYHGLSGRPYQGFLSVRTALEQNGLSINKQNFPGNFRNYATLTKALHAAQTTPTCGSPLVSDAYNDQGVFDFFRGSFALFGADARSTYYFYFLLIGASALIYLICFWRNYAACALLFACIAGVYSFMPSYVLDNEQLISVSNSRFLSTLGIIPLLHLLMTLIGTRHSRMSWTSLISIVAQSAIMALAIAARATAQWMEIAFALVIIAFPIKIAYDGYPGWSSAAFRPFLVSRGAVALYVVATLVLAGSLRAISLPPSCGTAINEHPFWHNMFIGLSFNPDWPGKIEPEIGLAGENENDHMVFTEAQLYAQRHYLPYQTKPSIWIQTPNTLANGNDLVPFGSWQIYEGVVRKAFFEFVREHPRYTLRTFFIYKPELLVHHLHNFFIEAIRDLTPFDVIALAGMIIAIGVFAPIGETERRNANWQIGGSLLLAAFCGAMSTVPLLAVYPDDYLIADPAYLAVAVVMLLPIWAIAMARTIARGSRQAGWWISTQREPGARG